MKTYRFFLLSFFATVSLPSTARAEWEHRADILTSIDTFGYRAAKIVSNNAPEGSVFTAGQDNKARGEVRARFRIVGSYLHFELEPYTIIPERALMVNLAGIEGRFYVPVCSRLRLGYYHHSSHNFNDGSLGGGIVLDGLMVDVLATEGEFEADGDKAYYNLRVNGTGFLNRRSPAHLLTGETDMLAADTGETAWRASVYGETVHPLFRGQAGLVTQSEKYVPASLALSGALTFKLAPAMLGELREHLYIGPYFSYGMNFARTEEFGRSSFVAGIRIDVVVSEFRKKKTEPKPAQ